MGKQKDHTYGSQTQLMTATQWPLIPGYQIQKRSELVEFEMYSHVLLPARLFIDI